VRLFLGQTIGQQSCSCEARMVVLRGGLAILAASCLVGGCEMISRGA
jgi:hypothetical protein